MWKTNFKNFSVAGLLFSLVFSLNATNLSEELSGRLVDSEGNQIDISELSEKKHVLFYYSASWCPPCKIFTPGFVDFYEKNGGGESFEVVLVSSDRNAKAMYKYMKDAKMPWLALDFQERGNTDVSNQGGPYIPSLVVYNNETGEIVYRSFDFVTEEYYSPQQILDMFGESIAS